MKTEKIIKREDGSQVLITAGFYVGQFDDEPSWSISVNHRAKGKKNWLGTYSGDDYNYRKLNGEDREKFILDAQLNFCTLQEMNDVKMILWESLKPAEL